MANDPIKPNPFQPPVRPGITPPAHPLNPAFAPRQAQVQTAQAAQLQKANEPELGAREQFFEDESIQTPKDSRQPAPKADEARRQLVQLIHDRVQLGIVNINVPLTIAIFKQQADILLRDPNTPPEIKSKIEDAKYDTSTEAQAKAGLALVTGDVKKRIEESFKKNDNYSYDSVMAAMEIVDLVGKYGGFNDEALSELYKKDAIFKTVLNNPSLLEGTLDIIVKEVDSYMDEAKALLDNPDKQSQDMAQKVLKFADLAIASEDRVRARRELNTKLAMMGIRSILAIA